MAKLVMPGLVPGIHVFASFKKDVDGRVKPGHDEEGQSAADKPTYSPHPTPPYSFLATTVSRFMLSSRIRPR
jgi:hypothetical protein